MITEFDIDFESSAARPMREYQPSQARFPQNTEEPLITEVSAAELPIVQIAIGGEGVPERTLLRIAEELQRDRNSPPILEATGLRNRKNCWKP